MISIIAPGVFTVNMEHWHLAVGEIDTDGDDDETTFKTSTCSSDALCNYWICVQRVSKMFIEYHKQTM